MFSSGWLDCFPAKLFIPLKKYTSHDYGLLGLSSDHMCRKGTSSLGWMQPWWWQQIWVWHWAYALPIRYMLGLFSLPALVNPSLHSSPCTSWGVVHMGRQYSHQVQWLTCELFVRTSHSLRFSFTFPMATELIPKPYCGKSSLEFNSSFSWITL